LPGTNATAPRNAATASSISVVFYYLHFHLRHAENKMKYCAPHQNANTNSDEKQWGGLWCAAAAAGIDEKKSDI